MIQKTFYLQMKRGALTFLFLCLISFGLFAQNIKLNVTGKPLKEVLSMITEQTGYKFVYSDTFTEINDIVTINYQGNDIKELLDKLSGNKIIYKIEGKNIALSPISLKNAEVEKSTVSGSIVDDKGEPIPGVTVHNTTTGQYTSSDFNGNYEIAAQKGNTLVFTSIGMTTAQFVIDRLSNQNLVMHPETTSLDAIMVVAYGTAKKSTFTGSAASVNQEKFDSRPVTDVTQALSGTTAGVQVGTANGQPGSSPSIRIRGLGSFNASSSPLIVLDGMPYDNAMSSINPSDIESMTILKDASSAALYGARAANGVILITTKKGHEGKMTVDVRYNIGFTSRQTEDYKTLGMDDYMQMYWESTRNNLMYGGATREEANQKAGSALLAGMSYNAYNMGADQLFDPSTGKINPNAQVKWADDLDWRSAIERVGIRHDGGVLISGATGKSDYYSSVGYTNDQGYIIGSSLSRYSAKANVNSKITKWLKVGTNLSAAITDSEGNQNESSGNNSNPFRFLRYVGNIYPIHLHNPETGEYLYDADGNKLYDFGLGYTSSKGVVVPGRDYVAGNNPAIELQNIYDGYRRETINAKVLAEISFLKYFTFNATAGVGANAYRGWSGSYVYPEKGNAGTSTKSSSNTTTWTINQLLTYAQDFGNHHVDAMIGHESYDYEYNYLTSSMKGQIFIGSNFEFKNFSEVNGTPNSYTNKYTVEGYLSRVNYDYNDKYFASASFRRDGSSRFYKDVRWGNFWSVGGGWRIDREEFMKAVDFIDMLKLRASYGVVGNDDLDSYYPWRATYTPYPNGTEPGYLQSSLGNQNLSWEVSHNLDAAIEFSALKGAVVGTVEFFNRQSSNLLFEVPQPISSGVESQSINAGTMYNRGVEFTFDVNVFNTNDFRWNITGNVTYLKNKLTSLPLEAYTSSVYKIEEGHPRYEFWLRQWKGVNPATGYNLFEADVDNADYVWGENELIDYNGVMCTETIEHAKYDWSGVAIPKFTGGFGSVISYKNWTLSFNLYYQLGGKYYDSTYASLMSVGTSSLSYSKLHEDLLGRWQSEGDVTNIAKLSNGNDSKNINAGTSTRWLVSSNMLELSNVNLTYTLPKKVISPLKIDGAKIYFSADNALLFTARRGMFPRRNFFSGYDGNADIYLPSRTFSFGVKVNF